ncbi:MAG TPA: PrsW family intramembrane metalloprotease [Anaerolineae bacterium]|nr:PrsW family intramembrane metalloprotease [Anaerolineae bacterium]
MTVPIIVSFIIATLVPLLFLYIVHALDVYGTDAFGVILLSFVWGIVCVGFAFVINNYIGNNFMQDLSGRERVSMIIRYWAPIVEEILKAVIFLYLIRRSDFTYFVDGAIYGFAIGIGFAVAENYYYLNTHPDAGLSLAITRVLSTNLMHAVATGLSGIAIGRARFARFSGRFIALSLGLILAILFHMGFNNLVDRSTSSLLFIYATVGGFIGLGGIAWAIRQGLKAEAEWIKEKQEELISQNRLSSKEANATQNLGDIELYVEPLVDIIGREKVDQMIELVTIQARLGINRKSRDQLTDDKLRQKFDKQIADLDAKMNALRAEIGPYAMTYFRISFPDDIELWDRLEKSVTAISNAPKKAGGFDLFAAMGQRSANLPAEPKEENTQIKEEG